MPTLEEVTEGLVPAFEGQDGVIYVDAANLESWLMSHE
jgi:hypothetical protein